MLKILLSFICLFCFISCSNSGENNTEKDELTLLGEYNLSFGEPSGLAINNDATQLWVVSGETQKIYKINNTGTILKTLNYSGSDLEGIVYDSSDSTLWVTEERTRVLVHLDLNGNVISKDTIDYPGELNHGLEGVCFDDSSNLFVVNEQIPVAILELNWDKTTKNEYIISFALDLSDITYSKKYSCFLLVSDENKCLYYWNKSSGKLKQYDLIVDKYEGIALDETNNKIYLVNDELNILSVYSFK
ncbi:MAG: SdiA-regulated domain-containing protein [bacterium]